MTMKIEELFTISDAQVADLLTLMQELSQNTCVDAQMLRHVAAQPSSHLFAMTEADGKVIGTATLCVIRRQGGRHMLRMLWFFHPSADRDLDGNSWSTL